MKTKTDPHIEELIDKELAEHGYTRSDFSKKEIAELRSEIIAKENGASILDGFWSRVYRDEKDVKYKFLMVYDNWLDTYSIVDYERLNSLCSLNYLVKKK